MQVTNRRAQTLTVVFRSNLAVHRKQRMSVSIAPHDGRWIAIVSMGPDGPRSTHCCHRRPKRLLLGVATLEDGIHV
jgi:hypothetical protein